jgi:hypothetical protein
VDVEDRVLLVLVARDEGLAVRPADGVDATPALVTNMEQDAQIACKAARGRGLDAAIEEQQARKRATLAEMAELRAEGEFGSGG